MESARFDVLADAPPAPPTGLSAAPGNESVSLAWNASPEPDVVGYRVYRSDTSGGPYAFIDATASPSFTDVGLVNDVTVYYVVTAVDSSFESGYSTEAAATPTSAEVVAEIRYRPDVVQGECLVNPWCRRSRGRGPSHDGCSPEREREGGVDDERWLSKVAKAFPRDKRPSMQNLRSEIFPMLKWPGCRRWACPAWIFATVELPAGFNPSDINVRTVRLAGSVGPNPLYRRIVDQDNDGIPELELLFSFSRVAPLLEPGANSLGLTGLVGSVEFQGSASIQVEPLSVALWLSPRTLNRKSHGRYVLAFLTFDRCVRAADVNRKTLRLNETVSAKRVIAAMGRHLLVKFDRDEVIDVLPAGDSVEVRVSGEARGVPFEAKGSVRVIK
jgi:hypothetical protein